MATAESSLGKKNDILLSIFLWILIAYFSYMLYRDIIKDREWKEISTRLKKEDETDPIIVDERVEGNGHTE